LKTYKRVSRKNSLVALAVASVLGISSVSAEDINGSISSGGNGYTVTAVNVNTGSSRTIDIDSDGSFRFSQMSVGEYEIVIKRNNDIVARDNVRVSLGTNAQAHFELDGGSDRVLQIVGASVSPVDLTVTDSGLVMGDIEFEKLPVARSLTGVSLLAPGTVPGDRQFGGASFGGSSVAENACFINGLEVTNTRQGLGCGSVPFEFYKEFQVKTGGYSPAFGRSTGGIMNAVTKSGSNEWEFGATARISPNAIADGKISRGEGGTGNIFVDTRNDESSLTEFTFSASGPLVKDELFVYAILNPRDYSQEIATGGNRFTVEDEWRTADSSGGDNLFWGVKLDWDINDDHRLSWFGYSNRNDTTLTYFDYDAETETIDPSNRGYTGRFDTKRGGEVSSISYTGHFTDDLVVTALYGSIDTEYENVPENLNCPSVTDNRNIANPISSCGPGGSYGANNDSNTQFRLDVEYSLNDHTIAAGIDKQDRDSVRVSQPITGHSWTYDTLAAGATIQGDLGPIYTNNTGAAHDYVSDRIFTGGGGFYSELTAWYITDKWEVSDNLTVDIGIRQDDFTNVGTTGKVLTDFSTDIAPRLGFSWDPSGDGKSKFFGTWGKYYLPIANNTIFRAAAGISDITTFYTFSGVDSTGAPTGLSSLGSFTSSVATIPEKATFQSQEADPYSKVELILGYQTELSDALSMTIRATSRDVDSALDDYCGIYSWPYCVMLNPGSAASWYHDGFYWDGSNLTIDWAQFDGAPDPGSLQTYSAQTIGLPKAINEYTALQTEFNYQGDDIRWNFIYTWSRSWGNFEGAVKSDIGQADAGITQDFDFPALMDGAEGYQANDRRHVFKFYGSYDMTEDFTIGWNSTLSSGRPLSAFGRGYPNHHPDVYGSYGDTFYVFDAAAGTYTRIPRGTVGRTPWLFKVDLNASYKFKVSDVDMRATFDIFNVFNSQEITAQNEHYERTEGTQNQYYGAAYSWQAPTSVRLGLEIKF